MDKSINIPQHTNLMTTTYPFIRSVCCSRPHLPIQVSHKHTFQSMDFTSIDCPYDKTLCAKTNVKQLQQFVKECWVETTPSFH